MLYLVTHAYLKCLFLLLLGNRHLPLGRQYVWIKKKPSSSNVWLARSLFPSKCLPVWEQNNLLLQFPFSKTFSENSAKRNFTKFQNQTICELEHFTSTTFHIGTYLLSFGYIPRYVRHHLSNKSLKASYLCLVGNL